MDLNQIIEWAGNSIYAFQALGALIGGTLCVILFRQISLKRWHSSAAANDFESVASELIQTRNWDELVERCDSPPWWTKATAQLLGLAVSRTQLPAEDLEDFVITRFERDVISDMEHKIMWVNTVIKSAPMLGLLGTVAGMISAFGKIATMQKSGTDPSLLANDISLALITTAVGLVIAIPLMVSVSAILIRLRRLQFEFDEILLPLIHQVAEARLTAPRRTSQRSSDKQAESVS